MKASKIFQLILGLFVVAFIFTFIFSLVVYIANGKIDNAYLWAMLVEFFGIMICFPCITLSVAGENRNTKTKCEKPTENKIKGL